jgi:NADH dehydrogenase
MVTGATGFVGRSVVREFLSKGLTPVCLVRSAAKLLSQHPDVDRDRFVPIVGNLSDREALRQAAERSQAAIHLVGIILARRFRGQTFDRIHTQGTINVVDAVERAGIRRYVHMSALGSRPDAVSAYHRTKWAAEESVRRSGLEWTIFRPSLIHGPGGEFMRLMKRFMCGLVPPVVPYFGSGLARIQPVSVKDVAHCMVRSLSNPATIGQTYPLGGPKTFTWRELYNACRALMPGARHWKPVLSQPVAFAKFAATVGGPIMALSELIVPSLGLFRFDAGQVQMSQEDSVCDHTIAERAFGLKMRSFEDELAAYADQIR